MIKIKKVTKNPEIPEIPEISKIRQKSIDFKRILWYHKEVLNNK